MLRRSGRRSTLLFAAALALASLAPIVAHAAPGRLLVFSKTAGYRHTSIEPAIAALQSIAPVHEWTITATEDAAAFTDGTLAQIDLVLFLSTTDDVLDDAQQTGLQTFVEAGGGFVGIHSASATEETWDWYRELVGARFVNHPTPQDATVHVVLPDHPACDGLPAAWMRFDEWYNFDASPTGVVDVLMQLDETTYEGGTMGADHPIAWTHTFGDARVFYTGGGHTDEAWADPLWIDHVANGIDWVLTDPPTMGDTSTGGGSSEGGDESSSSSGDVAATSSTSTTTSSTSTSSTSEDTTSAPEQDDETAAGCGCRTHARPAWWLLLFAPIVQRRRAVLRWRHGSSVVGLDAGPRGM